MNEAMEQIYEMEEDTQKGKYLIFAIGQEDYGIEIRHVIEIIGIQTITSVPELPSYIRGVINLRGKIIPVMDVRLRFDKEAREYDDRTCVIVVEINEVSIGLIVDRVAEVINIDESDISQPPRISKGLQHKYIQGIGKVANTVKLILNCDRLLNNEEVDDLVEAI